MRISDRSPFDRLAGSYPNLAKCFEGMQPPDRYWKVTSIEATPVEIEDRYVRALLLVLKEKERLESNCTVGPGLQELRGFCDEAEHWARWHEEEARLMRQRRRDLEDTIEKLR